MRDKYEWQNDGFLIRTTETTFGSYSIRLKELEDLMADADTEGLRPLLRIRYLDRPDSPLANVDGHVEVYMNVDDRG